MLTVLPGLLNEGVDAAFSVVPLRGHCGDVVPAHGLDNVHHGLGLVGVRRHNAGEEVVAGVVAELRGCGGVAHLGYLHGRENIDDIRSAGVTSGENGAGRGEESFKGEAICLPLHLSTTRYFKMLHTGGRKPLRQDLPKHKRVIQYH